jgi:hypothetical protein
MKKAIIPETTLETSTVPNDRLIEVLESIIKTNNKNTRGFVMAKPRSTDWDALVEINRGDDVLAYVFSQALLEGHYGADEALNDYRNKLERIKEEQEELRDLMSEMYD